MIQLKILLDLNFKIEFLLTLFYYVLKKIYYLGRIKNIPPNMLLDQFGMIGLLAYLKYAEKEREFFTLALGTDLTALGLNLNSNEYI